jgi:hypothetical protein
VVSSTWEYLAFISSEACPLNGVVARLLSREPRFLLQKVTTVSIPVAALGAASLTILEATEKLPRGTVAAASLREWWRQDWEAAWERLRQSRSTRQGDLPLGQSSDTLPL